MSSRISTIMNLGPATEAAFATVGLTTAEDIRDLGADGAYLRWLSGGQPAHFIGYYALVLGLQGRPWNDCGKAERARLRERFDALKAEAAKSGPLATWSRKPGRPAAEIGIEAALDEIGLIPRR